MTTLAPPPEAAKRSAELRATRAKQKAALQGAPPSVLVPALVNPTPGLGSYTLDMLFGSKRHGVKLLPGVGRVTLNYVFGILNAEGFREWHGRLRLGELTVRERRRLVKELLSASEARRRS